MSSRGEADEQYNNEQELKKTHTVISCKKREKLIQLVIQEKMTIYRAAKRLKICHPTAKFIVKNYRIAHGLPRHHAPPLIEQAKAVQNRLQMPQIQKEEIGLTPTQAILDAGVEGGLSLLDQVGGIENVWAFYGNNCFFQPFYYYS